MHDAAAVEPPNQGRLPLLFPLIRAGIPSWFEALLAGLSALFLVLAFPDFDFWWLAWIGLVPLVFVVAKTRRVFTAFLLGWLWGTIFFYGTCWWLTYPMIHYGQVPVWLAYPLLFLPVIFVSIFPGLACAFASRMVMRFGSTAIFSLPIIWVALDWLRYVITGQVWNTLGYSQAFHPALIQSAAWGGVYIVTLVILLTNVTIAYAFLSRRFEIAASIIFFTILFVGLANVINGGTSIEQTELGVIAIQPNVPMESLDPPAYARLTAQHLDMSRQAVGEWKGRLANGISSFGSETIDTPLLVIWPESPMNFSYSRDPQLQKVVADFARANQTSVLLNSLEPAPNDGGYNSAILINQEGEKTAQYDKIRLMPFGEYVPLPRWLPGSGSVRSIVGEFTPGSSYTLMPLGAVRAGVFICVEAVHPAIARSFTNAGADVLINISNDGYLGPTPVMRQHLANAVFRAVENNRKVLRVTNTGISAFIRKDGSIAEATPGFQTAVRTWHVNKAHGSTFYSRHGDVFVYACALISLGMVSAAFMTRSGTHASRHSRRHASGMRTEM